MFVNERASRTEEEIREGLLHIYSVMEGCVEVSLKREGLLPGGLKVRRRAPDWHERLMKETRTRTHTGTRSTGRNGST